MFIYVVDSEILYELTRAGIGLDAIVQFTNNTLPDGSSIEASIPELSSLIYYGKKDVHLSVSIPDDKDQSLHLDMFATIASVKDTLAISDPEGLGRDYSLYLRRNSQSLEMDPRLTLFDYDILDFGSVALRWHGDGYAASIPSLVTSKSHTAKMFGVVTIGEQSITLKESNLTAHAVTTFPNIDLVADVIKQTMVDTLPPVVVCIVGDTKTTQLSALFYNQPFACFRDSKDTAASEPILVSVEEWGDVGTQTIAEFSLTAPALPITGPVPSIGVTLERTPLAMSSSSTELLSLRTSGSHFVAHEKMTMFGILHHPENDALIEFTQALVDDQTTSLTIKGLDDGETIVGSILGKLSHTISKTSGSSDTAPWLQKTVNITNTDDILAASLILAPSQPINMKFEGSIPSGSFILSSKVPSNWLCCILTALTFADRRHDS